MKNEPAFPMYSEIGNLHATGLTKREYFAGLAMQGMATVWYPEDDPELMHHPKTVAKMAVEYADMLIAELEKK